jgi:methyl-accepting chemotaxis protein
MKNSKEASILPKIIFAPAAAAAAVFALGVEVFFARGAAEGGAFLPLLVGGIVNIVILVLACLALCLVINRLFRRLRRLEKLMKPLAERDYAALAALSETPVQGEDAAVSPLRESLAALGQFLAALERRISKNREMKETLDSESAEQDAVLRHLEEAAEAITKQFYDIETWSQQGIGVLENLEAGIKTLGDAAEGQSGPPENFNAPGDPGRQSRAAELSELAAGRLRENADRAEKVKEVIDTGEEQARDANELIKAIAREVDTIAEMINIINQISEQTNILSMNAAIESAHAGQAGAGFAVVADEIRKLADSTRENAGRIHGELKEITGKTREALKASEGSFQTFNRVSGETSRLAKDLAGAAASALEAGVPKGGPEEPRGNASISERMKDGIAGVMACYQSLKTALELIGNLSGKTRTGVKEIHSGTREILENIHTARLRFLRYLEETEDMEKFLPPVKPAVPLAVSPPPVPQTAPQTGTGPVPAEKNPEKDYSDSRDVVVKRPPRTIP